MTEQAELIDSLITRIEALEMVIDDIKTVTSPKTEIGTGVIVFAISRMAAEIWGAKVSNILESNSRGEMYWIRCAIQIVAHEIAGCNRRMISKALSAERSTIYSAFKKGKDMRLYSVEYANKVEILERRTREYMNTRSTIGA